MKTLVIILGLFFGYKSTSQTIELVKLDELNQLIDTKSDQLKVINFWASWCGPCIKEMPYFDEAGMEGKMDLYFVSLDFVSQKEKASKILDRNDIKSKAYLLDEKDADKYIASINGNWSGAIPATLFITPSGERVFYERALEKNELATIVKNLNSK